MKFGMPLGNEFRPARGHLELSSPRVGYFFLTDTLKQQTNTVIGTLAVDGWVVTFETGSGWGLGNGRPAHTMTNENADVMGD